MNQFKKMFSAQWKMTLREKQAWFWGIFYPVILMSIFMLIFGGSSSEDFQAKVAIVNNSSNENSELLLSQISSIPILQIETKEPVSKDTAIHLVKEKDVDAAIVLPDSGEGNSIGLIVNKEDEQSVSTQAVSAILDKLVQQANLSVVGASPTYTIEFESVSAGNTELSYTDFLLTGMIALSISQGGMFGMVGMVDMRRKGLIKRLRMTPAHMGLFGLSDIIMRLLFSVVQIVLLTLIGILLFGANLFINFPSLLVIFLIGSLAFTAMGYLFSSFSNTTQAYMGVANISSFLMMFLSGIFFPVETMPDWLQPISNILPLTYFAEGLRDSMVYDTSIFTASLWLGIGNIVIWGLLSYGIGLWLYRSRSIVETR
ncbi:ABC transporter permease [Ferdinandcohnia sp. Marseille-Q9671]